MNRRTPRILIVEDDETMREVFRHIFEGWTWETRTAATAAEALALLGVPLDLIFLDLMLPDAPGTDVLREIRARNVDVPVAVVTGKAIDAAIEDLRGLLRPGDELLNKPFAFPVLRALARRIYEAFTPRSPE